MKRRVVFDVNILVSAVLSPGRAPSLAIEMAVDQRWTIVRSSHIDSKYFEVLTRPRFDGRVDATDIRTFIEGFRHVSIDVTPDPAVTGVADDEEDDRVLGTAVAGRADIIVSGDKGLLALNPFLGIPIVTARTFLDLFGA